MIHTIPALHQSNTGRQQLQSRLEETSRASSSSAVNSGKSAPGIPNFQRYFHNEIENDENERRNSFSSSGGERLDLPQVICEGPLSSGAVAKSAPAKASGLHEYDDTDDDLGAYTFPEHFDLNERSSPKANGRGVTFGAQNVSPPRGAIDVPPTVKSRSSHHLLASASAAATSPTTKRKRIHQTTSRLERLQPDKFGISPLTANQNNATDTADSDEDAPQAKPDPNSQQPPPPPPKPTRQPNPQVQQLKNTLTSAWRKFDKALSVDPDSSKKRIWNMFALLVVTINCIMIPVRIGWSQHQLWWIPLDLLSDLVTLIDMFLFSISMYVKDGAKVHEFRFTVRHYVMSWYFLFDALSIVPIDIIGWFVGGYSFFRLNRMLRLTREKYYFETIEELFPQIKPTIIRLLRSILFTLNCIHFISCFFFYILDFQGEDVSSVDLIPGKVFILRMHPIPQYIRCFFWALVTMTGYQNTQPQTNLEVAYSIMVCAVGLSLYITIIGTVGSLMSNLDASKQYFISRMDQINAFMNFRELPSDMQEQIREYYTYLWKSRRSLNESNVFIDLPMHLQIEVAMKLNEKFIKKVDIFQGAEQQFIERIVVKMKPKLALPNVYIVRQGEIGREMYLISKGEVEVVLGNGLVVATLPEGKIFGEIALLENCRRNASIRAKTHCDLFTLSKKDFTEALEAFPQQKERVAELARRKKEETAAKSK